MKMKVFGPPGGGARPWRPPLDPPMKNVAKIHHLINKLLVKEKIYTNIHTRNIQPLLTVRQ